MSPRRQRPEGGEDYEAVIRVSRRKGRGDNGTSFLSPDQQRDILNAWAQRTGNRIVRWWNETDSVSGRTTQRDGLQGAMAMVRKGRSAGVAVAKADRFCRNTMEGLMAIRELRERGGAFVAVQEGIESWDPRDAMGKLFLTIVLAIAEWQYDTLTNGWVDARERHVGAGIANHCPWGYVRGEDRRLAPDLTVVGGRTIAAWVAQVFSWRAGGASWSGIARHLDEAQVPPPGGGKLWRFEGVRVIVANRHYLGEVHSGPDIVNREAHPALVSVDLFEQANRRQGKTPDRHEGGSPYALAGLVFCASCGGRMRGNTNQQRVGSCGDRKPVRYYRCRARFSWGVCPHPAEVNAAELEGVVFDTFDVDYLQRRAFEGVAATDELAAAQEALRSAEADLAAFVSAPSSIRLQAQAPAAYEEATEARLDAVDVARDAVAAVEAEALGASLPEGLADIWGELGAEDRRALLSIVYAAVVVAPAASYREPAVDRSRVFRVHDDDVPELACGRGVTGLRPVNIRN